MGYYIFIDEEQIDRDAYARILSTKGLTVRPLRPDPELTFLKSTLADPNLEGVLVDYLLSAADPRIPYRGGTLAAHIRSERPDVPIVVLSAALKRRPSERASYERLQSMFDVELDKSAVTDNADTAVRILRALADGYRRITNASKNARRKKDWIADLLALEHDEQPEVVGLVQAEGRHDIAGMAWAIIHMLLRLPGPLLDLNRTLVSLCAASSEAARLSTRLKPAVYQGIFAELSDSPRYWANRLNKIKLPKKVLPAECIICGGRASAICEGCRETCDGIHSLGVMRAGVPKMFADGRLCGFCLAGEIPEEFDLNTGTQDMVDAVIAEAKASKRKAHGKPR